MLERIRASVGGSLRVFVAEFAKFGAVGLFALVIDISLFNILRFAGGEGPMYDKPLTAKIVSVIVATVASYFGNRYWSFKDRGRTSVKRELPLFFLLNGIAMALAVGCLWLSHYVLGLDNAIADNISANVIGLAAGTLFRFWSYRRFVFPAVEPGTSAAELAERDAVTPI